jgi:hypothetical protein
MRHHRHKLVLLIPCLIASAAGPAIAEGTCNVRGPWDIFQSNGPVVRVTLSQNDQTGVLVGTASHEAGTVVGTAKGAMSGRSFQLTISWAGGAVGEYIGVVGAGDRVTGTGFEAGRPANVATWNSGDKSFFGCP